MFMYISLAFSLLHTAFAYCILSDLSGICASWLISFCIVCCATFPCYVWHCEAESVVFTAQTDTGSQNTVAASPPQCAYATSSPALPLLFAGQSRSMFSYDMFFTDSSLVKIAALFWQGMGWFSESLGGRVAEDVSCIYEQSYEESDILWLSLSLDKLWKSDVCSSMQFRRADCNLFARAVLWECRMKNGDDACEQCNSPRRQNFVWEPFWALSCCLFCLFCLFVLCFLDICCFHLCFSDTCKYGKYMQIHAIYNINNT